MLEKQALIIAKEDSLQADYEPPNELYGLASVYHSSKAYFFSATYDAYHKKLLQQVFSIQSDQILECPNKLEISEGHRVEPFESRTVIKEKETDLREAFITDLLEELYNKPFIVFEAFPD